MLKTNIHHACSLLRKRSIAAKTIEKKVEPIFTVTNP